MGLALTAFEVWRRLPPAQRRMILDSARKQAPRAARRPGAMGVALTAFEVWRRLPPAQRRMILYSAREQAPRAAAAAVAYWRARKPR
jgi:acyl-CoA reductase-like NAD-dependent aldehyde dehydrogenase